MRIVPVVLLLAAGFALRGSAEATSRVSCHINPQQASRATIAQMIEKLRSSDPKVRAVAKDNLQSEARRSLERKGEIVQSLIELLQSPKTAAGTWYDTAELLGDLKATEAINTLVEHLDYNDGIVGLSSAHVPAARALVSIGQPAVPALVKALSHRRASVRANAALALGEIGGKQAFQALERASKTETNAEVRSYIQAAMNGIARQ
jgi:HEAT repeat protein